MGKWFPVFVFQEWSPLYSAPLVQSPQEQDSKLQEANNVYKDNNVYTGPLIGGKQ